MDEPAGDSPHESDRFDALFADLAAEHEARDAHERLGELGDLVAGEYADHGLCHRLAGAIGRLVELRAAGIWFDGRIDAVGREWVLLRGRGHAAARALVNLGRVDHVRLQGIAHGGDSVISTLSIRSPLRGFADSGYECRIVAGADAQVLDGQIHAIGADYLQMRRSSGFDLIPLHALAVVQDLQLS